MKILFIIDSLNKGGAEKALISLLRHCRMEQHEITVMTLYDIGIYKNQLPYNIKYVSLKLPLIRGMNYIAKFFSPEQLHHIFIKDTYDIEVAFLTGIVTKIVAGAGARTRKLAWVRTDIRNNKKSRACFFGFSQLKQVYQSIDRIGFVGEENKKVFSEYCGIDKNLYVVENIVDINEILFLSTKDICKEFPSYIKRPVFLAVGRLEKVKGYERLLRVHKRLIEEGFLHTIVILGTGRLEKKLKKYVCTNALQESVVFKGFLENPFPVFKMSNWFLLGSLYEGFSSVLREAAVLEVPVAATDCTGVKEVLGNSEYGIVIENDENSIYRELKRIIQNPELEIIYKEKIKMRKNIFSMEKSIERNQTFILGE